MGCIFPAADFWLRAQNTVDSFGGPVWALAPSPDGTLLAAGCEDGTVKLFETGSGALVYQRSFDQQEGRILSLHWHPSGAWLVSGGSAGVIHVWSVKNGRCKVNIRATEINAAATLIWNTRFLAVRMATGAATRPIRPLFL